MEYCRAITKKELLCKRKACKNSVYCTQHKPEDSCSKFKYSISNELVTDYTKILPDDIIRNIYKMYFTSNVLEELKKYDPQGDFSRVPIMNKTPLLERDYQLVREHNLWHFFIRNPEIYKASTNYRSLLYNPKFRSIFYPYYILGYTYINMDIFQMNMLTIEYIANNGWFKYIMK
jgi:hypothetical protein